MSAIRSSFDLGLQVGDREISTRQPLGSMSAIGTFETIQDVHSLVAKEGKADNILLNAGVFSVWTQLRHRRLRLFAAQN